MSERPPYDATAVRPPWAALPGQVRAHVEELAGSAVLTCELAGGGFTRGFAGLLRLAGGDSVFVKAASEVELPVVASSYRQEALVLTELPAAVPAPRLRWTTEHDGWVILGIDPVTGRMPGLPWTAPDIASAVRACEESVAAFTARPVGLPLPRLADDLTGDAPFLSWFTALERGDAVPDRLTPWARSSLPVLQRLVDGCAAAVDGDVACHGDLRPDNMIIDGAGRAWVCDWNWLALGAPWTDLVGLLVTVHADGIDADAVLRSSRLGEGVEAEAVDAWLAFIAAFMLGQAGDAAPSFASPWLPWHRAYFGTAALSWLERRRG